MTLFDRLVEQAMVNQEEVSSLRSVVEKELFHHEILRIMGENGFLQKLTFIGGTCLRDCYGSHRLSEDLEFTGGTSFQREDLGDLAEKIKTSIKKKYGFSVDISEPVKESGNVDTWKVKIATRPERPDLPGQKIHLDICSLTSHEREPRMLINHYGVDLGTGGLIVQAQSRREILTDKYVALGLRPNRIKNRDLWDIIWLNQANVKVPAGLLKQKLEDRKQDSNAYIEKMDVRIQSLRDDPAVKADFRKEMSRFLPLSLVQQTVLSDDFWTYLSGTIREEWVQMKNEGLG